MSKNVHVTDAIKLEGFQAILEPGKFGYSLAAIVGTSIIDALETERQAVLKWAESKLKNPKRATLKPTPWEEVADGKFKIKFSWGRGQETTSCRHRRHTSYRCKDTYLWWLNCKARLFPEAIHLERWSYLW